MKIHDIYDRYIDCINLVEEGSMDVASLFQDTQRLASCVKSDPAMVCAFFYASFGTPSVVNPVMADAAEHDPMILDAVLSKLKISPEKRFAADAMAGVPGGIGVLFMASKLEAMRLNETIYSEVLKKETSEFLVDAADDDQPHGGPFGYEDVVQDD